MQVNDKQLEYIKCFRDKSRVYFIEHYLSTFDATERRDVPFMLFPRQKVFLQSLCDYNNTIAIKHRQCGVTTISSGWITGQITFATKKSPETVLCIANKLEQAVELVNKIITFLGQVPRWMWGDEYYSPDPDSEKNKKSIFIKKNRGYVELFNGCKIYARSSGENAARGISAVTILIFDEAAFIQNGTTVYAQAIATTNSVSNAKVIMVSTPNGKDPLYYQIYSKAVKKENNYHVVEFRWFQDLRYNRFLKWYKKDSKGEIIWDIDEVIDSKGNITYDEERWKRLEREGWTPESPWYINTCKTFNNDEQKIAQEINVSFMGSADNVVPVEIIEAQSLQNVIKITPEWELRDPFIKETWIWKDPIPGHRYVCACLPEGEMVMTDKGLKKIENIDTNDKLLNEKGELINYKVKKYRNVIEEDVYNIKLHNTNDIFTFTGNHPIWSSLDSVSLLCTKTENGLRKRWYEYRHNFKFNKCSQLKKGDWVEVPNQYHLNEMNEEELLSYWKKYDETNVRSKKIDNPLNDEEFWWYCGIWLAEGFTHQWNLETSHNINEFEILNRVKNVCNRLFKRKCSTYERPHMKSTTIYFACKQIKDFIEDNFGKYSYGKYISEWIKYIPKKYKLKLIEGYLDGDGFYSKERITVSSVSRKLISDFQDLLFSCGYVCSIKVSKTRKEGHFFKNNKITKKRDAYCLTLSQHYTDKFMCDVKKLDSNNTPKMRLNMYFSDDLSKIYIKILEVEHLKYTGKVFNFETDETHTFGCRYLMTHNCDPSSGSGEDRTAIEILDADAIDEEGLPYVEQVLEYYGKMTGDEIGEMVFNYATIYNNALVVVEGLGGYGDATILTLMNMGYQNLYYDDPGLKTYTVQRTYSKFNLKSGDKLPGFRTNNMRIQMISNFVGMLKDNTFRVRSERVITELETWVFKNGRPNHLDGSHDDSLTCLSMGLFVMQYSLIKSDRTKSKDVAMMHSWKMNKGYSQPYFQNKNIDLNKNANIPYLSRPYHVQDKISDERRIQNAMIMMGGFKIKKS